jgi:RNA recognition motif-containing protein
MSSIRLYVGNLPKEFEREELVAIFADSVDQASIKVITDRKTGKCRGFAFVTVATDELADQIIAKHNDQDFKESKLKIEKAMPRKAKSEDEAGGDRRPTGGGGGGARRAPTTAGSRRGGSATAASSAPASNQPDPRWAGELEKLREMLNAQTTQS